MRVKLALFTLLAVGNLMASAPVGIPRDLARQRAERISDVRYRLQFALTPHASTAAGHEDLRFKLTGAGEVLLDFREGAATNLKINGKAVPAAIEEGHIVFPEAALVIGENTVSMDFYAPVAPAGKAITRFEDKDDGSEYFYTLFVPMDADMAFPCFDQPDMKGKFRLELTTPDAWTAISNTATESTTPSGPGQSRTSFGETHPISTYLFAFAAGPFRKVHDVPGMPGLYVRQSKLKKAEEEAAEVQQITAQGIQNLAGFFAQPFPFPKYDMVMLPGFAYGGMEHAGATFLREESILFRSAPTHSDRLNRDILLLHELTHQWFGDFTTMRWFDDLWLKEGFAQYMAYEALAAIKPNENIWKRFYQAIKPAAYGIDSTKGTTPIYQDIANLKDAKSAYGAIVYSKAPGVLKQLAFVLGEANFREGLRVYLKEHAYSNAEWGDLVASFERVSGRSLRDWAAMWIRHRGMPQVDVDWTCDSRGQGNGSQNNESQNNEKKIDRFTLRQHDVLGEGGVWPIATQVLLVYSGKAPIRLAANFATPSAPLREAEGKPCPQFVFANDRDYGYGRFLLDARSQSAVMSQIQGISDVFDRTLLWGSLWESLREAELAPRDFVDLALHSLPEESDESLAQTLIGYVTTSMHRYIGAKTRAELTPQAETVASDKMLHSPELDFRIVWFRGLRALAESAQGRAQLKDILSGKLVVPGVELRPLDRWSIVAELIALNDPDAKAVFKAEQQRDNSGDGLKYAYVAEAAMPEVAVKSRYFNDYLHDPSRPEDWVEQSLGSFNSWNQSELTLPFLHPALEALPQMKKERKIFFVLAWLNSFIGGQQSAAAQTEVREFLKSASADKDLQLKILEVSDELDRTVKIRNKYQ
ncbi:MAG TPA: M1 family aminopeptidase [Candidatus Angelobacter sp.]|nr:M1 family aminopeptidase [Candidatus Angelobacter sp.]